MDSKKQTKTFDLLNWQINSKHLGFQGGTSALFPLSPMLWNNPFYCK